MGKTFHWACLLKLNLLCLALICAGCSGGQGAREQPPPTRLGVLLTPDGASWKNSITLALENVAAAGAGPMLEARFVETGEGGIESAARLLLDDPSIAAVVGAATTSEAELLAPLFIAGKKALISPSATGASLFRAYSGKDYFWRTAESDVEQSRYLMLLARESGPVSVAALSPANSYGETFYDWLGFFAVELGPQLQGNIRYPAGAADCTSYVAQVLEAAPQVLIAVPDSVGTALCIKDQVAALAPATRLLYSDGGAQVATSNLSGARAEGMEGAGAGIDPVSGFTAAYQARFGEPPPPYGANAYDAALIAAYAFASSGGGGGEKLAAALKKIVRGTGEKVGSDKAGIARALALLQSGETPEITGAGGPLRFDRDQFTDPVTRVYEHWKITGQAKETLETRLSAEADGEAAAISAVRSRASQDKKHQIGPGDQTPSPRADSLWALVGALSSGWENYRHQADALAQYQALKANGVDDDHIVLILADDLAADPRNPEPGVVRASAAGPDLYAGAHIDYRLDRIGPDDILAILAGEATSTLPKVLSPGPGANILLYLVGHGGDDGLHLGANSAVVGGSGSDQVLTPDDLAYGLNYLAQGRGYRRVLAAIDSCGSGSFGEAMTAPRVAVLTAGRPGESSLAANHDLATGLWRGDQFSSALAQEIVASPAPTLTQTYETLYDRVAGSHPGFYNAVAFPSADAVNLIEFYAPPSP